MTQKQKKMQENEERALSNVNVLERRDLNSLEIADLTGKAHRGILRDIRNLQKELNGFYVNGETRKVVLSEYKDSTGRKLPMLVMDSDTTLTLLTGYYPKLRLALFKRWRFLEEKGFEHNAISNDSKQAYKDLMETVLLEVEDKKQSDMEVAAIVNKATSNYFGLSKTIKMDEMSDEMLVVRIEAMKDFERATELFKGTDSSVKEFLYKKWSA